ncbi:pyrroline-5-carboxylate reductase [Aureispira anguillae]|uniref:Pyrroline-5-carboxylate reductase n=1 Tax=Aureispira anguillae TaxID=2864201 RepID=A0A915YLN0_9BACT|nr:pyrroline-5-carboxylate reductase [Aureispira anguillae]BDS15360.1 pyrroline-5-carboxylate reductase [Aureispira anguillae]
MNTIAILGGGNLGSAIAQGLYKSKQYQAANIFVTRNKIERLAHLKTEGIQVGKDNNFAVQEAQIIIIAVKPYKVKDIIAEIRQDLDPKKHILVSVATGITTSEITQMVGFELPIFRAMPNTAIEIQESITCICSKHANTTQKTQISELFNLLGIAVTINEELMEAATVLGACGIAYVFRFIRAMMQGGIEIGFDAITASTIAEQTVKGAAELLLKGGKHPEEEIDKVTTPKGCTISGLNEMEHRGFSSSLIKGILNSYQKIEK